MNLLGIFDQTPIFINVLNSRRKELIVPVGTGQAVFQYSNGYYFSLKHTITAFNYLQTVLVSSCPRHLVQAIFDVLINININHTESNRTKSSLIRKHTDSPIKKIPDQFSKIIEFLLSSDTESEQGKLRFWSRYGFVVPKT